MPMRSIIVFSDRCTLKNIQIHSNNISVIHRYNVASVISDICNQIPNILLTDSDIAGIYNKLYPYTQVDETAEMQHIVNVSNILHRKSVQIVPQNKTQTVVEQLDTTTIDTTTEAPIVETDEPIKADKAKRQSLKCPKCNGDLILRTATRGTNVGKHFYGCSNYPKCDYTQNAIQ